MEMSGFASQKFPRNLPNIEKSRRAILIKKRNDGRPIETHAKHSLYRYQNAGLESDPDEIVDIWFEVMSYSSVFKEVEKAINNSDPIAIACMGRGRLRSYWATDSSRTTKNCLIALNKFIAPQQS